MTTLQSLTPHQEERRHQSGQLIRLRTSKLRLCCKQKQRTRLKVHRCSYRQQVDRSEIKTQLSSTSSNRCFSSCNSNNNASNTSIKPIQPSAHRQEAKLRVQPILAQTRLQTLLQRQLKQQTPKLQVSHRVFSTSCWPPCNSHRALIAQTNLASLENYSHIIHRQI